MSDQVDDIPNVSVEIDGIKMDVPQGSMIIEAADSTESVRIPRFCYHKKLSVAANCRMCLVEVEGGRKPMPACATPVSDGMKVFTKSQKTIEFQKAVMEFLLINHPLDCPICDQGGECELQDVAMGYGKDVSKYTQGKRVVPDKDIGSLISTDLTRCIQCTRCVRFGIEIAGTQELGMVGRGEHSEIGTFLEGAVESELSGNVIDLCPVGALTAKPSRYTARPWELQQMPGIASHDCVGSHVWGHVRRGELMRVVPRDNESINECWISDRDRFGYEGLHSDNRATDPMIKRDGEWEKIEWADAFDHIVKVCDKLCTENGPETLAALSSPSSTVEEGYLLQKLLRQIGSNNIDFRVRQKDFKHQDVCDLSAGIDCSIDEIENFDAIILVGSCVRHEQPIIHHRIRNAVRDAGTHVMTINSKRFDLRLRHQDCWVVDKHTIPQALLETVKAVMEKTGKTYPDNGLDSLLTQIDVTDKARLAADYLVDAKQPAIFMGELAQNHQQASLIMGCVRVLRELTGSRGGSLTTGANSAGLAQAGVLPHRFPGGKAVDAAGFNAGQILSGEQTPGAVFLLNLDPALDTAYGQLAVDSLKKSNLVVAMTPFVTDAIKEAADIILPVAAAEETSGTFVNVTKKCVQSFVAMAKAKGQARPAWKVLRVMGNFFKQAGFDFETSQDVLKETQSHEMMDIDCKVEFVKLANLPDTSGICRVAPIPIYAGDMTTRHAKALSQAAKMRYVDVIRVSPNLASQLGVQNDDQLEVSNTCGTVTLPVYVDETMADRSVYIHQGRDSTKALGPDCENIQLKKV